MKHCFQVLKAHLHLARVEKRKSQKGNDYVQATFAGMGLSYKCFVPEQLIPDLIENKDYQVEFRVCVDGWKIRLELIKAIIDDD